jgi:Beta-propeller repeat
MDDSHAYKEVTMMNASRRPCRLGPFCALMLMSGAALAADSVRYSTYLGGSRQDQGQAIAVDALGNAYAVGTTLSTDFPVHGGQGNSPDESMYHPLDSFLTELSPDGSLLFSTYLVAGHHGDFYDDTVQDVAAGPGGRIYATGWIDYGEDIEVFVQAIKPGGGGYFLYLIGERTDQAFAIATDSSGNAYVTGVTSSFWFPTGRPNMVLRGGSDTFIVKLDPRANIVYARLLGIDGSSTRSTGIAVDSAGQVTVTGTVTPGKFPAVNATQPAFGGGASDAFVARLDPSGSALVYSTYLGGGAADQGLSVAVDATGNAYVTGATSSADFPTTAGALQTSLNGDQDIFVAQLDSAGRLVYSTYLGGSGSEQPRALALDSSGAIYLASVTSSGDSPLLDSDNPGCRNGLVARLDLRRSLVVDTACVSGADIQDIAVTPEGSVHVTGRTMGGLLTVNPFQPFHAGQGDAFVTRLELNQPPICSAAFASPATIWPPNGQLVPVSILGVTDPDGDPVILTITGVRQDEPLQGNANAFGIGTPNVSVRVDRSGQGDGRVYHLQFEARDAAGASCAGAVSVCVPHDRRPGAACGDGGALFSSAGAR